jgi:VanZ family protein
LSEYRYPRVWAWIGLLLLAAVITLSLVSIDQPIDLPGADKYEHALAYAALMFWWGMVQPHRRLAWAVTLPLLGVCLEGIQQFTPGRFMEWRDAAANLTGVVLGLLLAFSPAGRLLGWLDRQIANRTDPGRT